MTNITSDDVPSLKLIAMNLAASGYFTAMIDDANYRTDAPEGRIAKAAHAVGVVNFDVSPSPGSV
jgi:hypothetical protein